jgi:hypothetical protein
MTNIPQDELLKLAKEAGLLINTVRGDAWEFADEDKLTKFANLINARQADNKKQAYGKAVGKVLLDENQMKYIDWNAGHWTHILSAGDSLFTAPPDYYDEARQSSQSEPVGEIYEMNGRATVDLWNTDLEAGTKLYAAPQQAIPSGWMPIETAPKDGTEIDVWCFDSENEGYRVTNAWYCNALNKWRSYGDGEMVWANMPSYWMPLPASPTAPIERDK